MEHNEASQRSTKIESPPKAIYLEASVLFPLPINVINAEIERLKRLSTILKIPIYIPEVSFKEWISKRKEVIRKHIENIEKGLANLSKIFDYLPTIAWEKDKESITIDTELYTKKILDDNGIGIIQTPKIDLEELISMSINNIKPFEPNKEKGFRDSVNLFTVLIHAEKLKNGTHCFIANDKIYSDEQVQQHAKRFNVELIVISSIAEAISEIEKFMEKVMNTFDQYEKLFLKDFLLKNKEKISDYIKNNGEFSISFINKNFELGFMPEIVNITDINIAEIDSVTRGVLPKDATQGRIKISFIAKARFKLLLEEMIYGTISNPTIKFGEPPRPSGSFVYPSPMVFPEKTLLNKEVILDIPIEGSAFLTRKKDPIARVFYDEYSDLQIDNMILS